MKCKVVVFLLVALSIAMFSGTASAIVGADPILEYDAARTDIIFDGKVLQHSLLDTMHVVSDSESVTFRVGRVLKGPVVPGSTIIVRYPSSYKNIPELIRDDYVLVLVQRVGESYMFAKPPFSTLLVSETECTPYVHSDKVEDNIRWEILNSLKSPNAYVVKAALDQVRILSEEEAASTEHMRLLSDTDIATFVEPLVLHKDAGIRTEAIIALARTIDVQPAIQYLLLHPDLGDKSVSLGGRINFEMISAKPRITDLHAIAELLKSKTVELRQTASYLLREMGDAAAVPYLKVCLDDTDSDVRYHGVMGLAKLMKYSGYAPAYSLFIKDEKHYTDYWKTAIVP